MKEAAGEANLTVITIVLIGVVVAVGIILVPRLMSGTQKKACCTDAGGRWNGTTCVAGEGASAQLFNEQAYKNCADIKDGENNGG